MSSQAAMAAVHRRGMVPCRVCSSINHIPFADALGYRIVLCRDCGLWYVNPQPTIEELEQFYAEYDEGIQWRQNEEPFNRAMRDVIISLKQTGTVLDVGCGSGNFLLCMRGTGFSVFGIEPSKTGSEYTEASNGVEVFKGMVEEYLALPDHKSFDVVTLLNVLEHLTDPARTLIQVSQLMNPGGILAIVVPNAQFHAVLGGIRSRLGVPDPYWLNRPGSFASGFKLPHHLSSFKPSTLSALVNRCGFRVEVIENAPRIHNSVTHRNLGKWLVRSLGQAMYYLTLRRVVLGYSTLLLGRKD
jgi:SAM-dependent methyltransferase